MSDVPQPRLPLADERRIDGLCARFEAALRAGEAPAVDAWVDAVELPLRPRLREELTALRREFEIVPPRPPLPGLKLGGYRILQKIGEGGMGSVFEAVQETTRRRVALKVVRSDLGSEKVRRRFAREARLLGHLQHPGIAQIFDAGIDEHADPSRPTPYLVMELLRGLPLIAHADEQRLGTRDRLELVRRICGAVQHAHDQGIVHRDLKPANILVVEAGASDASRPGSGGALLGTPKVLDFGVARVLEQGFDASLETQTGQLVGTVAYMSPEQLTGDSTQVDGRTDVYALGVILYQLLAGRLPHDLAGLTLAAAVDRLRHTEPTPLGRIDPRLRGDVEIIVAKALEKRPAARYRSAAALAADLQRHLDDVPIEARPPDAVDRLAKFARRNRGLFAGIVTAGVVLLASLVVVSVFAFRQSRLRESAELARADAHRRERIASAVSEFLNETLRAADLDQGGVPRDTTIHEVLVAAADRVDASFRDEPTSQAAVRMALGASFLSQADFERAERQFRAALATWREHLPEVSAEIAEAESRLAWVMEETGRLDAAEQGYRRALELRRELAARAAATAADAPPIAQSTARHRSEAASNLAALLERRGEYARALEMREAILADDLARDGAASASHASNLNHLGSIHEHLGDLEAAERCYREALAIRRAILPSPHRHTANVLGNLALLQLATNRIAECDALLRETLSMQLDLFGPDHPDVAATQAALGGVRYRLGDHAGAAELQRRALATQTARLGRDHPDVHNTAVNLGFSLHALGEFAAGKDLVEPAVARFREHFGADHPTTLWALSQLAVAERALGNLPRAVELHRHCAELGERAMGAHWRVGLNLAALAGAQCEAGERDGAVANYRRAIDMLERTVGPASYWTLRARQLFAVDLDRWGDTEGARHELAAIEPHLPALDASHAALRDQVRALRTRLEQPPVTR